MKKTMFCAMVCIAVIGPRFVLGQMITEVMYDLQGTDTGREWVEIINNTTESFSLETLVLIENGSNHGLSVVAGSVSLPAGGYAVIADNTEKFLIDHPSYSGTLVESAFSLNNTGEELSIADKTNQEILDTLIYDVSVGAAGDGRSLQYNDSSWVAGIPTPGSPYEPGGELSGDQGDTGTDTNQDDSHDDDPREDNVMVAVEESSEGEGNRRWEYRATSEYPASVSVHSHFEIESIIEKRQGERRWHKEDDGHFMWYMGDGTIYERAWSDTVSHIYQTPGDYQIVFEYYSSFDELTVDPTLVQRVLIQVIEYPIILEDVREGWSVTLKNMTQDNYDLRGWGLSNGHQLYIFPRHTILSPGETRAFRYETLGLDPVGETLVLLYPDGRVVENPSHLVADDYGGDTQGGTSSESDLFYELQQAQAIKTLGERDLFRYKIWTLRLAALITFCGATILAIIQIKKKRQERLLGTMYQIID